METALNVSHLGVHYGPVHAVCDVSFTVKSGEITTLLGANGAGKTTTLMAVAGARKKTSGAVSIFGQDMAGAGEEKIVRAGVAITPEGRRIFSSLSVEDNLKLAGSIVPQKHLIEERKQAMMERFPILSARRRQMAGLLSGGEQQMLAVARALMSGPKLLLMDEPSLGLAPQMVDQIFAVIEDLQREGISVLLIEQNAAMALEIANQAVVLANGAVAAFGTADEIKNDTLLHQAYLAA